MRSTQFHHFAGMVVNWTRRGDTAIVAPLLIQPVSATEVGQVLAEIAVAPPQGRVPDLAGPGASELQPVTSPGTCTWTRSHSNPRSVVLRAVSRRADPVSTGHRNTS